MNDWKGKILTNLMICGVSPDEIRAVVYNKLKGLSEEPINYKPEIFFSYPEPKEAQEPLFQV